MNFDFLFLLFLCFSFSFSLWPVPNWYQSQSLAMAPEIRSSDKLGDAGCRLAYRSAMDTLQLSFLCTVSIMAILCSPTVTTMTGSQASFTPSTELATAAPPLFDSTSSFSYDSISRNSDIAVDDNVFIGGVPKPIDDEKTSLSSYTCLGLVSNGNDLPPKDCYDYIATDSIHSATNDLEEALELAVFKKATFSVLKLSALPYTLSTLIFRRDLNVTRRPHQRSVLPSMASKLRPHAVAFIIPRIPVLSGPLSKSKKAIRHANIVADRAVANAVATPAIRVALQNMVPFKVSRVDTKPTDGQKLGTSGLRKTVKVFKEPHHLPKLVQATFTALTEEKVSGATLVVSGDGRYFSTEAIQIIMKMSAANGVRRVWADKNGLLPTPAVIRASVGAAGSASSALLPKLLRLKDMTHPGVASKFEGRHDADSGATSDVIVPSVRQENRIVITNQLPIRSFRNNETKKWSFKLDSDSLCFELKGGFPSDADVIHMSSLKADIDPSEQEEVSQILLEKFQCVPAFLPLDTHNKLYHGSCEHYLGPLFHYVLPMSQGHDARFKHSQWEAYVHANKIFANKVKISPLGIHMGQLQSLLTLSHIGDRINEFKNQYEGRIVILGVVVAARELSKSNKDQVTTSSTFNSFKLAAESRIHPVSCLTVETLNAPWILGTPDLLLVPRFAAAAVVRDQFSASLFAVQVSHAVLEDKDILSAGEYCYVSNCMRG